jgi:hypothetical protein
MESTRAVRPLLTPLSRYDLPVTSRLGKSPTARQRVFDPDRAASRWPECCCACRPLSGGGGTDQPAEIHVFSALSFQPCLFSPVFSARNACLFSPQIVPRTYQGHRCRGARITASEAGSGDHSLTVGRPSCWLMAVWVIAPRASGASPI